MGLLDQFTKISGQDPLKRLVDEASSQLERRLENAVSDLFSEGLKNSNFSTGVANALASRFGDSFASGAADRYFRTASTAVSRLAVDDLFGSMFPKYAKTTTEEVNRMTDRQASLSNMAEGANQLQYPSQLGKYYMALKFRKYTRTAPQATAKLNFTNSIILPIPKGLVDVTQLRVENNVATGAYGLAFDIAQAVIAKGDLDISQILDEQGAAGLLMLANSFMPEKLGDLMGQAFSVTPNPHMAAFFNGVNMRKYSFEWVFAPRNQKESEAIQNIRDQLKKNSLPTFSTQGQAALTYPDLCFLELHPWAGDGKDKELIKFKPALIENVELDYSPNGIPSFFAGSEQPTFIRMKIDFCETEYFTAEDYGADRRETGLDNAREVFDNFIGLVSPEGGAGTDETGNASTEAPSTKPEFSNQADKSTVRNKIQTQLMPGSISEATVTTYQINGKTFQARVGKAGTNPITIEGHNGTQLIEPGGYWVALKEEGTNIRTISKESYKTLDDVVRGLEEAGAVR